MNYSIPVETRRVLLFLAVEKLYDLLSIGKYNIDKNILNASLKKYKIK
jgi:hypothetical protein